MAEVFEDEKDNPLQPYGEDSPSESTSSSYDERNPSDCETLSRVQGKFLDLSSF